MPAKRPIRYLGATITREGTTWRAHIPRPYGQGRIRKSCRDLDRLKAWIANEAADILRNCSPLSPDQAAEYRAAAAALPPGMSLIEAVHAAANARPAPLADRPAAEAIRAYLHIAEVSGRRPATIRTLRRNLKLLEPHSAAPLATLTHDQALALLSTRLAPQTRESLRRGLDAFFRWACRAGYAATSPFSAIPPILIDARMPKIHTPEQVASLFTAAQSCSKVGNVRGKDILRDHRPLIPYLALAFFAGIRPGALLLMRASAIDRRNGQILVAPEGDKSRRSFYAPISPTLAAWLDAYPPGPAIAPLSPSRLGIHLRRLYAAARVLRIPDGPRHCFASYTYAATGDAVRTAAAMGHFGGKTDVLFNHYRALVTPEAATAFFAILPNTCPKNDENSPNTLPRNRRTKSS